MQKLVTLIILPAGEYVYIISEKQKLFLDITFTKKYTNPNTGASNGLKGNSVQIGNGPAAVTGDEICDRPLSASGGWEGAETRTNRESEDLPV